MRKTTKLATSIALVILVAVGMYWGWQRYQTQRRIPTLVPRLSEVTPSSEFLNAQRAVEYYRQEIRKNPDLVKNYTQLAQLFLQEARVTGNEAEYIPRASALLDEALRRDPENFDALITKASLFLTLHQFAEGKKLAEKALTSNPYSAFGYGVLCDALVELGYYDDAIKACDKMLSLRPDLRSYSRASYLRELHGELPGAIEAMKLASDASVSGQEGRAWTLYNLGNLYLTVGKLDTAAFIYKGILEERPNYAYALGGLAHIKAARGEYQAAVDLLNQAYSILPSHAFREQLASVYRSMGKTQEAEALVREILKGFDGEIKFGANTNLEYTALSAEFGLNLDEALRRIKNEYEVRPNNIQVLEAYAWTLYQLGKAQDAVPLIERAMQLETRRSELLFRAGMIYHAAGNYEKARKQLRQALSSGLSLEVSKRQQALQVLSSIDAMALAN